MQRVIMTLLIAFFCLSNLQIFAQQGFAEIEKNINFRARSLVHELNATKDSLFLKSEIDIKSIYTIHNQIKHDLIRHVNNKDYEVSLRDFDRGKHVFVVVQQLLKIVFVVHVYGEEDVSNSIVSGK
ncbi:hypothetical protein N8768_02950 [Flavobacteriaceae bacterium]|jgi:hypothetical protein|nr:hypothetical protein [Flavobacteriaceae bacterium]